MTGTRHDLVAHVKAICEATDLPVNADSERCFPNEPGGVGESVRMLAEAGAAGCSIEDWDPDAGRIEDVLAAEERVWSPPRRPTLRVLFSPLVRRTICMAATISATP